MRFKLIYLSCLSLFLTLPNHASAQLIPDTTLGTGNNSIVDRINNVRQDINQGTTTPRGTTLFHSFQEFNVNAGESVFFNAPGITNIFTRVTGSNVSNIFGTLGVNGNANLFLINPNGIIFGQGARLDLNGSFTATTAENLILGPGLEFSAVNPQPVANNITINFPIGFGFGTIDPGINTGQIIVTGPGQNLQPQVLGQLIAGRNTSESLAVNPGQNLNLIGGSINLNGGLIAAEGGRVTIAAVETGTVSLDIEGELNFGEVSSFGNIQLVNGSLIDVSSPASFPNLGSGSVEVRGSTIELLDNSVILSQNQNQESGGSIEVIATESLTAIGVTDGRLRSGIYSETVSSGEGTSISIRSPSIFLENAVITSNTYGTGEGGAISISTNNLDLSPEARISTLTTGTEAGGDISIDPLVGNNIQINGIDRIITESRGTGERGELSIEATIITTPEVSLEAIERVKIERVVEVEEDENLIVSLLTRQSYSEYIDSINRSCQKLEPTEDKSQFGIKDVFPTKKFLEEGGSWRFDIFITTDDRSKQQENWNEVVLPNAVITGTNDKTYLGLVCASELPHAVPVRYSVGFLPRNQRSSRFLASSITSS